MKAVLDTSAYSAFKRSHGDVIEIVRRCNEVVFSFVVLGELLSGFRCGTQYAKNLEELREFLDHPRVRLVPATMSTADRYGRIYAALRKKGNPIPTNDMWVAAQTMETGAELVTFDRHFESVDGLALTLLPQ